VEEVYDYLNNIIKKDDVVIFPSSGEFMEGIVKKIKISRYPQNNQVFVENENGYKKWKYARNVIKK
jgi:hypothetical protein